MTTNLFITTVYIAGLFSFFSPCIFPLLPVYLGILSTGEKQSISKTLLFILGLSTSFVLLGFSIGSIGSFLNAPIFKTLGGIIVIIFGLIQMEVLKLPFLEKTKLINTKINNSLGGAFLLGFTFSLGWTPCIGPILTSILLISGTSGNSSYGAFMMFIYVLGLATPFVIFSLFSSYLLKKSLIIKQNLNILKKLGGALIIFMGILLLTNKLNIFL